MKLSLIIATYNRSQKLLRTLESLACQDCTGEWECIVVNNNSTDDTDLVFRKFASEHSSLNIRMILCREQGLSNARNCGIDNADGDILVFIDDDETVVPCFISAYLDFFQNQTALAAGGPVEVRYEGKRPSWMSFVTERLIANTINLKNATQFPKNRVPAGGNMAFQKDVFSIYGKFDPNLGRNGKKLIGGEENDLFDRIRSLGEYFKYVEKAKIYHYISEDKLTSEYFDKLCFSVGQSKRLRVYNSKGSVRRLLAEEKKKKRLAYLLAFLYTICFQYKKGQYLIRMREGILKGIQA